MENKVPHEFSEIVKVLLETYNKSSLFRILFFSKTAVLHYFEKNLNNQREVVNSNDIFDEIAEALIQEVFEEK